MNTQIPRRWKKESIAEPNAIAKEKAKEVCRLLCENYGLLSFAHAPSKEGGICVFYKNDTNNYSLIIETYNDGDIGGLVNDDINKKIILNEEVKDFDFSRLVKAFWP